MNVLGFTSTAPGKVFVIFLGFWLAIPRVEFFFSRLYIQAAFSFNGDAEFRGGCCWPSTRSRGGKLESLV